MRDKTKDERYFILTLFAIAKELKHAGELAPFASLDLAVGLPPEHYGMLKTKFSQYFKRQGAVNFVYNEKPVSISIRNVFVYPQAYAAIVQDKDKVLGSLRMFIIDVGGYTTDVLLLQNGKPDMRFCRSLETGIIPMSNDIVGKVSALHDMRLEDYHISAVLSGKETILPEDVKKLIRETAAQYATDILDKLRELQVDLRSNPAIFIGGGSILFRSILERSELVAKAAFTTDPKANAIGYEILAHGQLMLRSAQ